jgi:hypothetical protein
LKWRDNCGIISFKVLFNYWMDGRGKIEVEQHIFLYFQDERTAYLSVNNTRGVVAEKSGWRRESGSEIKAACDA